MKLLKIVMLCLCLPAAFAVRGQQGTYSVSGRVIDRLSRRPVAYAAVVLAGQERKGASTDSLEIPHRTGGARHLAAGGLVGGV